VAATAAAPAFSLVLNAVGATATGATLAVIVVSKLTEGAWITLLLLGALLLLFSRVRAHLVALDREVLADDPLDASHLEPPAVVVPMKRFDRLARKALRFALTMSTDVTVVQLLAANSDEQEMTGAWSVRVEAPCREAGLPAPKLVVLRSPYREVLEPLVQHVERLTVVNPGRAVAVIVPELVERRWYHVFLHNHTATLLKALLLRRGGPQLVIVTAPWYAREPAGSRQGSSSPISAPE